MLFFPAPTTRHSLWTASQSFLCKFWALPAFLFSFPILLSHFLSKLHKRLLGTPVSMGPYLFRAAGLRVVLTAWAFDCRILSCSLLQLCMLLFPLTTPCFYIQVSSESKPCHNPNLYSLPHLLCTGNTPNTSSMIDWKENKMIIINRHDTVIKEC